MEVSTLFRRVLILRPGDGWFLRVVGLFPASAKSASVGFPTRFPRPSLVLPIRPLNFVWFPSRLALRSLSFSVFRSPAVTVSRSPLWLLTGSFRPVERPPPRFPRVLAYIPGSAPLIVLSRFARGSRSGHDHPNSIQLPSRPHSMSSFTRHSPTYAPEMMFLLWNEMRLYFVFSPFFTLTLPYLRKSGLSLLLVLLFSSRERVSCLS